MSIFIILKALKWAGANIKIVLVVVVGFALTALSLGYSRRGKALRVYRGKDRVAERVSKIHADRDEELKEVAGADEETLVDRLNNMSD